MNTAQLKCLAVFGLFFFIGFGPVSPGCLIGMFITAVRPNWFWRLITNLYANLPVLQTSNSTATESFTRQARIKAFLCLLGLFIIDIAPVPVTPVIAFGIILSRPDWFYRVTARVYGLAI